MVLQILKSLLEELVAFFQSLGLLGGRPEDGDYTEDTWTC